MHELSQESFLSLIFMQTHSADYIEDLSTDKLCEIHFRQRHASS